jgi:hypothetical protein
MSVHHDAGRQRWVVRWREDGRQRTRRFRTPEEADSFDEAIRGGKDESAASSQSATAPRTTPEGRDGVYPYTTRNGVRWRFVFRQSDGTMSSRRCFTSRRAATRARERLNESIRRGEVKVARETFEDFWVSVLDQKRRYVTAGSFEASRRMVGSDYFRSSGRSTWRRSTRT